MQNIVPHLSHISYQERCHLYQQEGQIFWFTGLSGAGKTTIATAFEKELLKKKHIVCLLDGDSIRHGLNSDLTFGDDARKENIRRIAELAIYLAKQAIIVLVSVISPHANMREYAQQLAIENKIAFTEIYVKASLETCMRRDPKKLYQKVKAGEIKQFSGIDSIYEEPTAPALCLDTEKNELSVCLKKLHDYCEPYRTIAEELLVNE